MKSCPKCGGDPGHYEHCPVFATHGPLYEVVNEKRARTRGEPPVRMDTVIAARLRWES